MSELTIIRRRAIMAAAVVAFVVAFGLARSARAEDMNDVRGNYHGCKDVTASGGWDSITSADLESSTGSAVLSSGLYFTEVMVLNGSANVYLCLATGASCGSGTANKVKVASGAALALPLRGVNPTSVAIYATAATTLQVCAYFRKSP